jgi:uncharacterized protein (DUF885 family)
MSPRQVLVAGLLLAVVISWFGVMAQPGKDERFKALYDREWKWRKAEFPDLDDRPGKPVPDHLPLVDAASQQRRLDYWVQVLAELDQIPPDKLTPAERVNYEVYYEEIETLINDQRLHDYEMPANSDSNFWSDIGNVIEKPFRTEIDYRNFLSLMQDIPRFFGEEEADMRAGLTRGFTPPQVTMLGRDLSIAAVAEAAPEATYFFTPFQTMPAEIPPEEQAKLRAEATQIIAATVIPAYAELLKFMREEYLPGARQTIAASDLPDGAAYYRAKIKEFTTLDWQPETIHRLGLAEVERLHGEMEAVIKETGFPGTFQDFLAMLRRDPEFYAKTPEQLLGRAAEIAKEFDGKASLYFGYLPRARFAIKPVPAEIAPYYTAGRGGDGVYLVNTYDLPSRPLYNLTALTLHESAPGHAFQIPIAAEHKDQPEFRQNVYISAYGEGWAVYCEKLGLEMGMYQTPYDRFGMLGYQIWRAARLVVDTGIHTQGWSRQRAIDYLRENTALPEREIQTEIDRYIAWPAQALSYYLGALTIEHARSKAEAALGPKFNIRAFHDAVLELGSVPLSVLEARIDRFIAEGGTGPYPELE